MSTESTNFRDYFEEIDFGTEETMVEVPPPPQQKKEGIRPDRTVAYKYPESAVTCKLNDDPHSS